MNLEGRPQYTDQEKYDFYRLAAKRFKAETKLYGYTAAIHIENKNDEIFWGKVMKEAFPDKKFRFITSSRSIGGNVTCGCTQCLHYKDFLDKRFWIAIDSDYRYLTQQADVDAKHYILQTYTYSFENHFCYGENANRAELECCGEIKFDFNQFLLEYSRIVYPLLVWQLYLQGVSPEAFPQRVFHRLLTLPIGARATENNGASILQILKERVRKLETHFRKQYPEADPTWYEARCQDLGVHRDNCYLYVRGHQLYDLLTSVGKRIRQERKQKEPEIKGGRSFENYLTNHLCFGQYDEIRRLIDDAKLLGSN
ncbi:MAG: DUF4435 domain-containing protein [Bacteroidales bacterium]|nr:DUF4435 domain-containing protein [Bacteroidales bacterium]MBP5680199.1 DUF4435 domain-containing protein [Bacteroidales bacterium]